MTSFIEQIAPYAIKHGQANNISIALICAQACLESSFGNSELAVKANNLFGIKATNWTGAVYRKRTAEHKPDGTVYYIEADFRSYANIGECVKDLCVKYSEGLPFEKHNRYQAVIGETDYKKAAQAVKDAGYATDVNYVSKLNNVIEKYDLTKYDKEMNPQMVKIALDAGHGRNTAGKRSPENEREWEFNNKVLLAATAKLNTYENVQILRLDDPTGNTDVSLVARTNKANNWNADVLVSIHHNALAGKWHSGGGIETFVQEKTASKASKDIANIVQSRIVKAMGLRDRGVKTSNLHMTRSANAPAILTEGGFFDSTVDIKALRDDSKLKAQGEAIAEGLAVYFKLKPKAGKTPVANSPVKPTPVQTKPQPQKESVRMLKGTSATLNNGYAKYLEDAVKAGYIQDKWVKLFKAGKLPMDDAFLLDIHIREAQKAGK